MIKKKRTIEMWVRCSRRLAVHTVTSMQVFARLCGAGNKYESDAFDLVALPHGKMKKKLSKQRRRGNLPKIEETQIRTFGSRFTIMVSPTAPE
ncbi:hypothetical protein WA026_020160 [Henosepilachna vigintioctopunctata]|uniref:Uncharacterized protein n=1 Tax=Henosepilachna vigintioctopunctata TaxID=420089 RepID=A0AAW1UBF7_9CUCU